MIVYVVCDYIIQNKAYLLTYLPKLSGLWQPVVELAILV